MIRTALRRLALHASPVRWERSTHAESPKARLLQDVIVDRMFSIVRDRLSEITVLDVGCGKGRLGVALWRQARYFGLEYGQDMATVARDECGEPIVNGSATALPFRTASVDVVVAQGVLETLPDYRPAVLELIRVARRLAIFTAPVADHDVRGEQYVPGAGWARHNALSRDELNRLFFIADDVNGIHVEETIPVPGGRSVFVVRLNGAQD